MTRAHRSLCTELERYNAELQAVCPVDVKMWRKLKGLVYSLLVIAVVVFTGTKQMATWELAVVAIGSIVVFYVGEAKEIELAGLLTVIFERNGGQ